MDATDSPQAKAGRTFALIVGIEQYGVNAQWNLPGPAGDAMAFAEWLVGNHVPPENLSVFLSPLAHDEPWPDWLSREPPAATSTAIYNEITQELVRKEGDVLWIFWGGHGIAPDRSTRLLFCADAVENNFECIDCISLLDHLGTTKIASRFRQKVCLVDACAHFGYGLGGVRDFPQKRFQSCAVQSQPNVFAIFSTSPGQRAKQWRGRGVFSQEALALLQSIPIFPWAPDMATLAARITGRFKEIRQRDKSLSQVPTYLFIRGWEGGEESVPIAESAPRPLRPPSLRTIFSRLFHDHRYFAGREQILEQLTTFLQGPRGYCLIEAGAGYGKTALLVALISSDPDAFDYHFFSRLYNCTDEREFQKNLAQQLLARHHAYDPKYLAEERDDLRARCIELLQRDAPEGQTINVVIDALDETDYTWLRPYLISPQEMGRGVHVILSARPSADSNWIEDLGLQDAEGLSLTLGPIQRNEITALFCQAAAWQQMLLRYPALASDIWTVTQGDPFFVRVLFDDLRTDPHKTYAWIHQMVQEVQSGGRAAVEHWPHRLRRYINTWWEEIATRVGERSVAAFMGYMAAAKGPLTRSDLLEIAREDDLNSLTVDRAVRLVSRFIRGDGWSGYALCHTRFQDYVQERLAAGMEHARDALLAFCDKWHLRLRAGRAQRNQYAYDHYAVHLYERAVTTGDFRNFFRLLHNRNFLRAKIAHYGRYSAIENELHLGRKALTDAAQYLTPEQRCLELLSLLLVRSYLKRELERLSRRGMLLLKAAEGKVQDAIEEARAIPHREQKALHLVLIAELLWRDQGGSKEGPGAIDAGLALLEELVELHRRQHLLFAYEEEEQLLDFAGRVVYAIKPSACEYIRNIIRPGLSEELDFVLLLAARAHLPEAQSHLAHPLSETQWTELRELARKIADNLDEIAHAYFGDQPCRYTPLTRLAKRSAGFEEAIRALRAASGDRGDYVALHQAATLWYADSEPQHKPPSNIEEAFTEALSKADYYGDVYCIFRRFLEHLTPDTARAVRDRLAMTGSPAALWDDWLPFDSVRFRLAVAYVTASASAAVNIAAKIQHPPLRGLALAHAAETLLGEHHATGIQVARAAYEALTQQTNWYELVRELLFREEEFAAEFIAALTVIASVQDELQIQWQDVLRMYYSTEDHYYDAVRTGVFVRLAQRNGVDLSAEPVLEDALSEARSYITFYCRTSPSRGWPILREVIDGIGAAAFAAWEDILQEVDRRTASAGDRRRAVVQSPTFLACTEHLMRFLDQEQLERLRLRLGDLTTTWPGLRLLTAIAARLQQINAPHLEQVLPLLSGALLRVDQPALAEVWQTDTAVQLLPEIVYTRFCRIGSLYTSAVLQHLRNLISFENDQPQTWRFSTLSQWGCIASLTGALGLNDLHSQYMSRLIAWLPDEGNNGRSWARWLARIQSPQVMEGIAALLSGILDRLSHRQDIDQSVLAVVAMATTDIMLRTNISSDVISVIGRIDTMLDEINF